jgi:ribonuclease-3
VDKIKSCSFKKNEIISREGEICDKLYLIKRGMVRGYFVSEQFLSEIAKEIDLGKFIMLGKGEIQSGGKFKTSLLCDIFESLIAAIYIDGGYNNARKVVITLCSDKLDSVISENKFIDGKTELQKLTQRKYEQLPEYVVLEEKGPEHDKLFLVEVRIDNKPIAKGRGKSKKKAEQEAAKKALKILSEE